MKTTSNPAQGVETIARHEHERGAPLQSDCDNWCKAKLSGYSPGPWEVHGDETQETFYIHGANAICDIRKPVGFYRSPKETAANAALIAMAPDLLRERDALRAQLREANLQIERLTKPKHGPITQA